jgi:tRNA1(Val) A37 N6-methylase TrmN6
MLGITDADMVNNMTEERHPNDAPAHSKVTSNIEETKRIFAEMIKERGEKYVVNAQISDVMKDMWAAKQARRLS